MSFIFI